MKVPVFVSLSYIFIITGSIGMMVFATKFPFSTKMKDLKYASERFLGLNGYGVWMVSWFLIILGTTIQLIVYWITW